MLEVSIHGCYGLHSGRLLIVLLKLSIKAHVLSLYLVEILHRE